MRVITLLLSTLLVLPSYAKESAQKPTVESVYNKIGSVQTFIKLVLPYLSDADYEFLKKNYGDAKLPTLRKFSDGYQLSADGQFARIRMTSAKERKFLVNDREWKLSWPMNIKEDLQKIAATLRSHAKLQLITEAHAVGPLILGAGLYLAAGLASTTDCMSDYVPLPCTTEDETQGCVLGALFWPAWVKLKAEEWISGVYYPKSINCDTKDKVPNEAIFEAANGERVVVRKLSSTKFDVNTKSSGIGEFEISTQGDLQCLVHPAGGLQGPVGEMEVPELRGGMIGWQAVYGNLVRDAYLACKDNGKEFLGKAKKTWSRVDVSVPVGARVVPAQ